MKLYRSMIRRKSMNILMLCLLVVLTIIAISPLISIVSYIVVRGYHVINWGFLVSLPTPPRIPGGGIGPAIEGTIKLVAVASVMGIPTGILTAIYLSEYGKNGKFASAVRFVIDVMLGIPSIVVGIAIFLLVVRTMGGFSLLAGGIALGVMMIPIVARATEEILRLVPDIIKEAAYGLGIPKWRTIISVIIPYSMKGIVTGVMLGVARVAGETAPLIMTAFGSNYWNESLTSPTASLPQLIYSYSTAPYKEWIEKAWGAALVLIILVLSLNILARMITRGKFNNVT